MRGGKGYLNVFLCIIGFLLAFLNCQEAKAAWRIETVEGDDMVGESPSLALDSNNNPHISYASNDNYSLQYAYHDGSNWSIETLINGLGSGFLPSSLQIDISNNPHISYAFDGDLYYTYYDGSNWQIETVDSDGDVGGYNSLALDSNNNPHISYYVYPNQDLKYAYYDGNNWHIETVDSDGDVGWWNSLALDSNDNPHISYADNYNRALKYAYYDGSNWSIEAVMSGPGSGYIASSLAVDISDKPHISYAHSYDLYYAYYDGNNWHIETVDSDGDVGWWNSLALDSNDNPHISYYDDTNTNLKYAYHNTSSWQKRTVDSTGDVGEYTSLALDSHNLPHISYFDRTNFDLKYAHIEAIELISAPAGSSNPVIPLGNVQLNVTALDYLGHELSYVWSTTAGSFDDHTLQNPVWKAPEETGMYMIEVVISCTEDESLTATMPLYVSYGSRAWSKKYGGSSSDRASAIQQTTDGGYIAAGYTSSFGAGGGDIYLLKIDSSGNILWQKTYGGSSDDGASTVQQTTDGGYIVAGTTRSFGAGDSNIYLLKIDSSGNILWQRTYGGTDFDNAESIQQTTDGGYIILATTYSFEFDYFYWVLKLNENGSVAWANTYFSYGGEPESIQQTMDGGYIVAGKYGYDYDSHRDIFVLKLDNSGHVVWRYGYGGFSATSVQQTFYGGFIVVGSCENAGCVLKLDSSGNILWQKEFEGGSVSVMRQTSDGGYIGLGRDYSGAILLLKLDGSGNITWQKVYEGSYDDWAKFIQQTSDGGYVISGYTKSSGINNNDLWILKVDENGEIPSCNLISTSNVVAINGSASKHEPMYGTSRDPSNPIITDTFITPSTPSTEISVLCYFDDPNDTDADGTLNTNDNCLLVPNGPFLGTCLEETIGSTCISDEACDPGVCIMHQFDSDSDGRADACDNCLFTPNAQASGTCIMGETYKIGRPCTIDSECGDDGLCSVNQEDTNEDGIGDACYLCECDFDCNGAVDANDVISFLADFGRSEYNDPCTAANPCNGDVNCDSNVAADDVTKFLEDFGRNQFNNPCPACVPGQWCVYP
jgi:hypothetical protein